MDIFAVIAEPRRRTIMEMLAARGALSASEIGEAFDVSPPAISQHLKVLRDARVVRVEKRGQQRIYSMDPRKMDEVEAWVKRTTRAWEWRLDRLGDLLEVERQRKK